jgi:hypothetical protein
VIIKPKEGSKILENNTLDFEGSCEDLDLIYGDTLTFTWSSNITGELGKGKKIIDIKFLPGFHLITLDVKDRAGATSISKINITVQEIDDQNKNGGKKNKTENGNQTPAKKELDLILIIVPVIVIIIVIIIFLLVIRKKKKPDLEIKKENDKPQSKESQVISSKPIIENQIQHGLTQQPQVQQSTQPQQPQVQPQVQPPTQAQKPQVQPITQTQQSLQPQQKNCSTCGTSLKYYQQNNKYYCHQCKKYE